MTKKVTKRVRATAPSEEEIDAFVSASIKSQSWDTLESTMRVFGRARGIPPETLLLEAMNRSIFKSVAAHPEQATRFMADLEAADEAVAVADGPRDYSLEQIIENLRSAARSLGPGVQ